MSSQSALPTPNYNKLPKGALTIDRAAQVKVLDQEASLECKVICDPELLQHILQGIVIFMMNTIEEC